MTKNSSAVWVTRSSCACSSIASCTSLYDLSEDSVVTMHLANLIVSISRLTLNKVEVFIDVYNFSPQYLRSHYHQSTLNVVATLFFRF